MIKIHSRNDMHILVHQNPQQLKCVVLFEPDHPGDRLVHEIFPQCQDYIAVAFNDITWPREGYVEPQEEHIREILEWAKDRPGDLHVTCRAGISRSSAVAYLIACTRMAPEEAVKVLDPARHMPNELILKIGSKLIGPHILPPINDYLENAVAVWHV